VVEGTVDMIADEADDMAVLDFKTDVVTAGNAKELERLYSVQLTEYLDVVGSVAPKPTKGRLVFLPRSRGVQSHT